MTHSQTGAPQAIPSKPGQAAMDLDTIGVLAMSLLCLSWGLQQLTVKLALPELPPLFQAGLRSVGGCVLVGAWAWYRGWIDRSRDGSLGPGVAAGVLFALEFLLLYLAIASTDTARAVLFLYTAPFWVALGSVWLLPDERLTARQWGGLALAFCGVGMALLGAQLERFLLGADGSAAPAAGAVRTATLAGDLMALAAGFFWAATTLLIKATRLRTIHFSKTLLYQIGVSAPLLLLASWMIGEGARWPLTWVQWQSLSATTWFSLSYQVIWVAGITFLLWFWLIGRYNVSQLSVFTFLTPIVGIAGGALLLGESFGLRDAIAASLVVLGLIVLTARRQR